MMHFQSFLIPLWLNVLCCALGFDVSAQSPLPDFLSGTWQSPTTGTYEHWDLTDTHGMKGLVYILHDGQMRVSEYLDVRTDKKGRVVYTATVLNQNHGRGVEFTLLRDGDKWVFSNPKHDFPKQIIYTPIDSVSIAVHVTDGGAKGFSYTLKKVEAAKSNDTH